MATYYCSKCEEDCGNGKRLHMHQHGRRRSDRVNDTPSKCPINDDVYWIDGWTRELHDAARRPPRPQEKSALIESIYSTVFPAPPSEAKTTTIEDTAQLELLGETEIKKLTRDEVDRYALQLSNKLKQLLAGDPPRKRPKKSAGRDAKQEERNYVVYMRVRPGDPFDEIYFGATNDNERRKKEHDQDARKAARLSNNPVDERLHLIVLDTLTEAQALMGEYALHWSIDPSLQAGMQVSQRLPFILDDDSKWRRASNAEMRAMWCPLLVDKLLEHFDFDQVG